MVIAVLADIVGSRRLDDRTAAQRVLDDTIAAVEVDLPLATQPLTPTVGDEQQGVYRDLSTMGRSASLTLPSRSRMTATERYPIQRRGAN